jgi:hypothetical protein
MDDESDDYEVAHVVPMHDLREHVVDGDGSCWCKPSYDEEYRIFTHNSADGREAYERGARQPH